MDVLPFIHIFTLVKVQFAFGQSTKSAEIFYIDKEICWNSWWENKVYLHGLSSDTWIQKHKILQSQFQEQREGNHIQLRYTYLYNNGLKNEFYFINSYKNLWGIQYSFILMKINTDFGTWFSSIRNFKTMPYVLWASDSLCFLKLRHSLKLF